MGTRVAFFTAGTTGVGHYVRGRAIGRALARRGNETTFATFGPKAALRLDDARDHHGVLIDYKELADRERAPRSELAQALASFAPDVLLVDLFWAPLRCILPLPDCEAWFLVRRAPPVWLVGPAGYRFDRGQFDRVIAIEPGLSEADETIDPVVVSNREDQRPSGSLREALGVAPGDPLAVAFQAGEPGEWERLIGAHAGRPLHVMTPWSHDGSHDARPRVAAEGCILHDSRDFFPLANWLGDADAIVSGAGYNAYWEARWLGHDVRTTFVPFERRIDDQAWRVRCCADHVPRENGSDVLARRLV